MPHVKEIYKDFKKKGLEIIGISLDTDIKLLEDFLEETAIPWVLSPKANEVLFFYFPALTNFNDCHMIKKCKKNR